MSEPTPLLRCHDLTFSYGESLLFSKLSLEVAPGETVLLMGPSGGGKSTLAYCLAGLYPEYAGRLEGVIEIDGASLEGLSPARRARLVSILFQNPDNQFCMGRVDEEILFALENIDYPGDMRMRLRELLALVGLEKVEAAPLHTLSGGTKQKVALATALATEARLLILDEPFANIDPAACRELAALLRRLNAAGLTLLVVDHRLDWWRSFLTRIVFLEPDGTLADGPPLDRLEQQGDAFASRGLFFGDEWLEGRKPPAPPQPSHAAVTARGLSLYYGKTPVLENLSFSIERGSVTALIGTNGSGKSTLLSALAGIGRHRGELVVSGAAGLVFQNPRFQFLTLRVRDEVETTLRAVGVDAADRSAKADRLLDEFGLLDYADVSPYSLSQGQQRRLAILSMLCGDRPLLLLDEPTYAQDERATRFILDLLARRVADGLTAVLATHDLALAAACANRVLLLENGVLTELSPAALADYIHDGRCPA